MSDIDDVLNKIASDLRGADGPSRITRTLEHLLRWGRTDGEHHKTWTIDQAVRVLAGKRYGDLIRAAKDGEDGPNTYGWNEGIAP